MKKFLTEFKDFITKGNVLDLAVGVIIGGAFRAIVNSLVADLIMPLISAVVGADVTDWVWQIKPAIPGDGNGDGVIADGELLKEAVVLRYGNFIQAIIDFLIIAFVLFVIIKAAMASAKARENLKKKKTEEAAVEAVTEEPAAPANAEEVAILKEIVELLKKQDKDK